MDQDFKNYGIGLGLRAPHVNSLLDLKPACIDWLEVISENYMHWQNGRGATNRNQILTFREHWPIALHGVSMSIGSSDPLNLDYLKRLKELADALDPMWVSDHLCWTGVDGINMHDLLPLPYTEEAIVHIVGKIQQAQDFLGRRMLIENLSSYVELNTSEMAEWEFVTEIVRRSGCGLLLDINNVYVSSVNHNFDPIQYLKFMPKESVGQMHLAGHIERNEILIDTHAEPICKAVWDLYAIANKMFPNVSTMIERDGKIPEWSETEQEILTLHKIRTESTCEPRPQAHSARI